MAVHLHEEDLPAGVTFGDGPIAVDTEAMGLMPSRDRLCLVQLSGGGSDEHLVRFGPGSGYAAPNLKALLGDPVDSGEDPGADLADVGVVLPVGLLVELRAGPLESRVDALAVLGGVLAGPVGRGCDQMGYAIQRQRQDRAANDDHLGGILYASRHRAIAAVLLLQGLYVAR